MGALVSRPRLDPFLLAVGGCSSGVGKTTLVCRLLEVLPGWGALKTTPEHENAIGYTIVRDDPALWIEGSDTARYRSAGATSVAWLKYRRQYLAAGIREALSGFSPLPGLIVEGNSFASHVPPSLLVVVARTGIREVKSSAKALLPVADFVVINRDGAEDETTVPVRLASGYDLRRVVTIDASRPDDPGTRALLGEIATAIRRSA